MIVDVGGNDVRLVTHQQRHNELHAAVTFAANSA
jgi:hypothetical protein